MWNHRLSRWYPPWEAGNSHLSVSVEIKQIPSRKCYEIQLKAPRTPGLTLERNNNNNYFAVICYRLKCFHHTLLPLSLASLTYFWLPAYPVPPGGTHSHANLLFHQLLRNNNNNDPIPVSTDTLCPHCRCYMRFWIAALLEQTPSPSVCPPFSPSSLSV